jgi:capsular polysaccharide biosynthesis protein
VGVFDIMKRSIRYFLEFSLKLRLSRFYKTRKTIKIDAWFLNLLTAEFENIEIPQEYEKVLSTELLLNMQVNETYTYFQSLKMLSIILRTRGRLRWLCFRILPTEFQDSYDLTRLKLILRIFKNWNLFNSKVLTKLDVAVPTQSSKQLDIYEFTHPNLKFALENGATYILGQEISQKIEFEEKLVSGYFNPKDQLLGRLILWNSVKAMHFIREYLESNKDVLDYLEHFPSLIEEMRRYTKLSFVFHENAKLSFDDRMNLNAKNPDVLRNVEIWNQRFIVSDTKWHIVDSTYTPHSEFVAGHWQFLEQIPRHVEHVFLKKPTSANQISFNKAIFLMGRADENWYHLLLDTLPRFIFLDELDRDIPILVRDDLPETSIALIERLTDRKIIYVRSEDRIQVDALYLIAARSTCHDSIPNNGEEQVTFSPRTLRILREWILEQLLENNTETYPKELFLPRRAKYRNLINLERVSNYFIERDFRIMESNKAFFLKQYAYFSKADIVVSPGGAILANILFMPAGSKVFAIRSWRDSELKLWEKLAEACQVNYFEILGIPTYYGFKRLARQHSSFYVPLRRIKKALRN